MGLIYWPYDDDSTHPRTRTMSLATNVARAQRAIARYNTAADKVSRLEDQLYEARQALTARHYAAFDALPDGYLIHMGDHFALVRPDGTTVE